MNGLDRNATEPSPFRFSVPSHDRCTIGATQSADDADRDNEGYHWVDDPDEQKQREAALMAAARATWEDLAARARGLHCPEHIVGPWRVVVTGDRPDTLNLQIYGCCERLGVVVAEMIRADPRVSGPR